MQKTPALILLCVLLPLLCFSQRSKRKKGSTVLAATTINYYPAVEPYSFFSSSERSDRDLILEYITANSGKFTIEEGAAVEITRTNTNQFPSQLLGIGGSVQVVKGNGLFHEVALTKLSVSKSSHLVEFIVLDTLENQIPVRLGYDQRAAAFGLRYEVGKYFGDPKRAKVRFGISGGIEPSFYFYKREVYSSSDYPIRARLFTIEVAAVPMLNVKLSKKISLDFKVIPNMLLGDFGSATEGNPFLTIADQAGEREYNLPEINVAFSLLVRYVIKAPKR